MVRGLRDDAPALSDGELVAWARAEGLRVHSFKRSIDLPRVKTAIGWLKGLGPASLLDLGSGRGTFLWPLLDALPHLPVTAVDRHPIRVRNLRAVSAGGVDRLSVADADLHELELGRTYDGVTMLEVLEHLERPAEAGARAFAHAERFLIASVPSKPDDNPEHIHLFDGPTLEAMLLDAGARSVKLSWTRGHLLALALR